MIKLLKGGHCYGPSDYGIKDVLIIKDTIYGIEDDIDAGLFMDADVIDCTDRIVCPGFIDQHVHITGGGGEEGASSRIPEITLSEIIAAGVTTIVGVLGMDDITKNIPGLLAKASSLQSEGINAYVYTGSYSVPPVTLTGKVEHDLIFIDRVIGLGEVAISDYRSSQPTLQQLKELASAVLKGRLLGGKAGVIHVHVGDGKEGIEQLLKIIEETDLPKDLFVPTHVNRNKRLFSQALEFARMGGYIDVTAGKPSTDGLDVPEAISAALQIGIDVSRITVSSDGNGSIPNGNGCMSRGSISQLFEDIRGCILGKRLGPETVFKTVTENVAKILRLYPKKGVLSKGSDADILVLMSDNMGLDKVIIGGVLLMDGGALLRKGRFEH